MAISTVLLSSFLGIGLAGAASVGASALIIQDKNDKALWLAVDADTQEMEQFIKALQDPPSSRQAVLQNTRGLGLLFLQQGGRCSLRWGMLFLC